MTWQGWLSIVLALASAIAQVVALDNVRIRGREVGTTARRTLARRLQVVWRRLVRRPRTHPVSGSAAAVTTLTGSAKGYAPPPADLSDGLREYLDRQARRMGDLEGALDVARERVAALEAARKLDAEQAAALAVEQAQAAVLTTRWVAGGALLAGASILLQAFA